MMIGGLADLFAIAGSHSDAHIGVQIQILTVDAHWSRKLEEMTALQSSFFSFAGPFLTCKGSKFKKVRF